MKLFYFYNDIVKILLFLITRWSNKLECLSQASIYILPQSYNRLAFSKLTKFRSGNESCFLSTEQKGRRKYTTRRLFLWRVGQMSFDQKTCQLFNILCFKFTQVISFKILPIEQRVSFFLMDSVEKHQWSRQTFKCRQ